jgi:hypothetical protein
MPTENYKAFPTVAPESAQPHYFDPKVDANTFGAFIGRGLEQAGQGINKAADTWGEIQKDSVLNNAIKEAETSTEAYSKLQGADALHGEQAAKDNIDQVAEKYRSQLPPGLAHQFDTQFRAYQYRLLNGKISTHAIQQGRVFTEETNKATLQQSGDLAALNYNNPEAVDQAVHRARDAAMKQVQASGNAGEPGLVQQAIRDSDSYIYSRAAEAMFVNNAPEGAAYVESHRKELGGHYTQLAEKFRARATEIGSEQKADVLRRIYQEPDPTVRQGIANANRAVIGPEILPEGAAPPKSNVVPIKPGTKAGESEPDRLVREAKEKLGIQGETDSKAPPLSSPAPRVPGQTMEDWYKSHAAQQKASADYPPGLPFAGAKTTSEGQGAIDAALQHTVNAHSDRNFFSSGAARRQGISNAHTTIGDSQGHTIEVNESAAPHFAGFLRELADTGYKIRDIGGYSNRKIFGTNTYSEHAFGNAIDINPNQNPQEAGGPSNMPANIRQIAAKYGLIWGGDWSGRSRDPMHFEWSGKGTQVAGQ